MNTENEINNAKFCKEHEILCEVNKFSSDLDKCRRYLVRAHQAKSAAVEWQPRKQFETNTVINAGGDYFYSLNGGTTGEVLPEKFSDGFVDATIDGEVKWVRLGILADYSYNDQGEVVERVLYSVADVVSYYGVQTPVAQSRVDRAFNTAIEAIKNAKTVEEVNAIKWPQDVTGATNNKPPSGVFVGYNT